MKSIVVHTRGCFRHTNTLYTTILHTPNQEPKPNTLGTTDAHNQKIEQQTIKWEDLNFAENWVVDQPQLPKVQSVMTSLDYKRI